MVSLAWRALFIQKCSRKVTTPYLRNRNTQKRMHLCLCLPGQEPSNRPPSPPWLPPHITSGSFSNVYTYGCGKGRFKLERLQNTGFILVLLSMVLFSTPTTGKPSLAPPCGVPARSFFAAGFLRVMRPPAFPAVLGAFPLLCGIPWYSNTQRWVLPGMHTGRVPHLGLLQVMPESTGVHTCLRMPVVGFLGGGLR